MKKILIQDKLKEIGIDYKDVNLGLFDEIAEFTARRFRPKNDPLYKTHGCFYRSNYERGIFIYYLITQFKLKSMLELGFGRGYSSYCAAMAFEDSKIQGKIITIDANPNLELYTFLRQTYPKEWSSKINLVKSITNDFFKEASDKLNSIYDLTEKFDLIYIDAGHSYEETKKDWLNTKDLFNKFLLFDDYVEDAPKDHYLQCKFAIDEIEEYEKEFIIMDRRLFPDDLNRQDSEIHHGQVLITKI